MNKAKATTLWLYSKQKEALTELVELHEDKTNKSAIVRGLIDRQHQSVISTHDFVISQIPNRTTVKPYAYCNCKACCGKVLSWYEITQILNKNV